MEGKNVTVTSDSLFALGKNDLRAKDHCGVVLEAETKIGSIYYLIEFENKERIWFWSEDVAEEPEFTED